MRKGTITIVVVSVLFTFVLMLLFESTKEFVFKGALSSWQSHWITIFFTSMVSLIVALTVTYIFDQQEKLKLKLEKVIIQSKKMVALGGLAAGMAHEINNPLSGIIQSVFVMETRLFDFKIPANRRIAEEIGINTDDFKAYLEKRGILTMIGTIKESGNQIGRVLDNMLSFSKNENAVVSPHDPVDILEKALQIASIEHNFKNVDIIKEYENNLPLIYCERSKIMQVLLNILRNGNQAMREHTGGNHKVRSRFVLRLLQETKTGFLRIEIDDNGPGMSKRTRKRIFEPFFTTKQEEVGTGLGLSISYFIVCKNHGGTLKVVSESGKGATFIIRLPLSQN